MLSVRLIFVTLFLIFIYLCLPKYSVGTRETGSRTVSMAVPEATVDEDRRLPFGKNEVGRPRQIAAMKPEAQPERMSGATHRYLRLGVLAAHLRHVRRSGRRDRRVRLRDGHSCFRSRPRIQGLKDTCSR